MRRTTQLSSLVAAAAIFAGAAFSALPASSQVTTCGPAGVPSYTTWQTGWNTWNYDQDHVVLGMVGGFSAYRLTVVGQNGTSQVIDLKPGTAIFPTGQTPSEGEHVAAVGYWSRGTFIVNRLVLRP